MKTSLDRKNLLNLIILLQMKSILLKNLELKKVKLNFQTKFCWQKMLLNNFKPN